MSIERNELVAVVGQVGCGKSSLMAAVLGELRKLEGSVNVQVSGIQVFFGGILMCCLTMRTKSDSLRSIKYFNLPASYLTDSLL